MRRSIIVLAAMAASSACSSTDQGANDNGWTAEQQAAYDQCLQDNMAVSVAWEMIEQSCRDEVDGKKGPADLLSGDG